MLKSSRQRECRKRCSTCLWCWPELHDANSSKGFAIAKAARSTGGSVRRRSEPVKRTKARRILRIEVMNVGNQPMTRQRLKQYRALEREIRMLDERLSAAAPVSGCVRGSDEEPSDTEHAITIPGVDQAALRRLEHNRMRAHAERSTIERFIDSIEDSLTRTILEERYS